MTEKVKVWVIGAGGLVGSAVVRTRGTDTFQAVKIPWDSAAAISTISAELDRFVDWIGDDPWSVVWAAGAGVMRTRQAELDTELDVFTAFCHHAAGALPQSNGGVYMVSSAGGMFAGSAHPPFNAATVPRPLNAYGRSKFEQERVAVEVLAARIPLTVGRLSNAYGPGQSLTKQQGLVTELARCALLNKPATIFAPLPTLRDYVYVDDAARVIVADVRRMTHLEAPEVERRVVCSGRSTSIAELIAIVEKTTGRTFPVIHALAGGPYLLDLRLDGPRHSLTTDASLTPLEAGVALVHQDLLLRLAAGQLATVA